VALNTELTPELIRDGIAKDAIRLIQDLRKRRQCNYTDRIAIKVFTKNSELAQALEANRQLIASETLASNLDVVALSSESIEVGGSPECELTELADEQIAIELKVVAGD
jgi:isoleucyl-tRNA synthetase